MNGVVWLIGLNLAGAVGADARELELAARADAYRRVVDDLLMTRGADGAALGERLLGDAAGEMAVRRAALAVVTFEAFRVDAAGFGRVTARLPLNVLRAGLQGDGDCAWMTAMIVALGTGELCAVGVVRGPIAAPEATGGAVVPAGWENVSPAGVDLAVRAAREDVRARLRTRLVDLVGRTFADRLDATVDEAVRLDAPEFAACQVCVITGRLRVGDAVTDAKLRAKLAEGWLEKTLEAQGYGVAPLSATYRVAPATTRHARPQWADRTLVATGRGADADVDAACRAARVDALLKLAREVDSLPLPAENGGSVRAFVRDRPAEDDVWAAYYASARVVAEERGDGACAVTMALDLGVLWELVVTSYE